MSEFRPTYPRIAIVAAGGILVAAGCTPVDAQPMPNQSQTQRYEGHFAATCPEGTQAGILDVRTSGAMPKNPTDKDMYADAAVTVTCFGNNGRTFAPNLEQDTNGGKCLGYKPGQYHLILKANGPENTDVTFFTGYPDANSVDVGVSKTDAITRVEVHHHSLGDPFTQRAFKENHCEEIGA